jgi:virulence-associated protein VagC
MHDPKTCPLELTIFKSGNSAALRLPKALGFAPGERILAYQDGEALVLRHADALGWPTGYFESWEPATIERPEPSSPARRETRMKRLFGKTKSF